MSASQSTPNIALPKYVGTDKPSYTDWNDAVTKIDTAVKKTFSNIHFVSGVNYGTYKQSIDRCVQLLNTYIATLGDKYWYRPVRLHVPNAWSYLPACSQHWRNCNTPLDTEEFTGASCVGDVRVCSVQYSSGGTTYCYIAINGTSTDVSSQNIGSSDQVVLQVDIYKWGND